MAHSLTQVQRGPAAISFKWLQALRPAEALPPLSPVHHKHRLTFTNLGPCPSSILCTSLELLDNKLRRLGTFFSGFKSVSFGCKDPKLKHVQSLRRHVFMFLDSPTQTLEVSFRVKHRDGFYIVDTSSGQLKCFECGDVGHKRFVCPHKRQGGPDDAVVPMAGGPAVGPPVFAAAADLAVFGMVAGAVRASGPMVGLPMCAAADSSDVGMVAVLRQQASVAPENLSSSWAHSVGTEAGSQSADITHIVITNEGQYVLSSQISCEGEDIDYESVPDTASILETSWRNMDIYSLQEIQLFG